MCIKVALHVLHRLEQAAELAVAHERIDGRVRLLRHKVRETGAAARERALAHVARALCTEQEHGVHHERDERGGE